MSRLLKLFNFHLPESAIEILQALLDAAIALGDLDSIVAVNLLLEIIR